MTDCYKSLYEEVNVTCWEELKRYSECQNLNVPDEEKWSRWIFRVRSAINGDSLRRLNERYVKDLEKAYRMPRDGSDASVGSSCARHEDFLANRQATPTTWNGSHSCSITVRQLDYMTGHTLSGRLSCSPWNRQKLRIMSPVQCGLFRSIGGVNAWKRRSQC